MKSMQTIVAMAFIGPLSLSPAIADPCDRDNNRLIDSRTGSEPYINGEINYESRVERHNSLSNKYIWCIENKIDNYVVDIKWGKEDGSSPYFEGSVRPHESRPRVRTNSGAITTGDRNLRYRATVWGWESIDVETIYFERADEVPSSGIDSDAQTNSADDTPSSPEKAFLEQRGYIKNGIADFPALLSNVNAVLTYVKQFDPLELVSYAVFDVPATKGKAEEVVSGQYQEYEPRDFIALEVRLVSQLFWDMSVDDAVSVSSELQWDVMADDGVQEEQWSHLYQIQIIDSEGKYLDLPTVEVTGEHLKQTVLAETAVSSIRLEEAQINITYAHEAMVGTMTADVFIGEWGGSFYDLGACFVGISWPIVFNGWRCCIGRAASPHFSH